MKILITGSAGFIGGRLAMRLFGKHLVYSFDLQNGDDIRDTYKLEYLFETNNFDTVVHCAALAGVRRSELYPEEYISTNIIGTKNLIELSEKYGVKHFINFSSSSVYGSDSGEMLKEDDPKNPKSIYGMTKLMAEQIVSRAKIPTTTVRPFTVYGENGRADQLLAKWIQAINMGSHITVFKEDGKFPARGYTYVEDLIDGVEKIFERDIKLQPHAVYNLGGDQLVNVQMIAEELKTVCTKSGKVYCAYTEQKPDVDPMCNFADTTKARVELGWKPKTDFFAKVREIFNKEIKS